MAELSQRVSSLSARKRALLELRLGQPRRRVPAHGGPRLFAYVVPARSDARFVKAGDEPPYAELLTQWQMVYDETYRLDHALADPTFNTMGWNSSYTGLPISAEEMREQVDRTVARILRLSPRRVLEIGCGTGLLLFRIAPHCSLYHATDFSSAALEYVDRQVETAGLTQVRTAHAVAHDFDAIGEPSFDTIILNSVVQYFPSVHYLADVIQGAVRRLVPGGSLFIGDIRSLPLLEAFHVSLELHDAAASMSIDELRERLQMRVAHEQELVVDPGFFQTLPDRLTGIARVEVQPKSGRYRNELNHFRYDVVLQVGTETARAVDHRRANWRTERLDCASLEALLRTERPEVLEVGAVPDVRLHLETTILRLLSSPAPPATVGELRAAASAMPADGADPEVLSMIGRSLGYDVDARWAGPAFNAHNDLLFRRSPASGPLPPSAEPQSRDRRPWDELANSPLRAMFAQQHVPALRRFLEERLPDYMVPSSFVVLDALPRTPNGKIDRAALPRPEQLRATVDNPYVAPRTPAEELLARLWAELLDVPRVAIDDNFFTDLGGHSLLATQLVSRVRQAFHVELPLRKIFEAPTIRALAMAIEELLIEDIAEMTS
jgi:SAM-dependent methyltransferase/acyl carrier protein